MAKRSANLVKCNKSWDAPVTAGVVADFEAAFEMDPSADTVKSIIDTLTDLMLEYVGQCKKARSWKTKAEKLKSKLDKNLA